VNNVSFDDSMNGKVRKYDDSSYMNGEPLHLLILKVAMLSTENFLSVCIQCYI